MDTILQELGNLSPGTLAAIAAIAGATGTIAAALVTVILGKLMVSPFLGARDRQDKEAEWRKHAIELTKLDLEGKLRTRAETDKRPPRPSVLNFLANYRDLQELGTKTPTDLYLEIRARRTNTPESAALPTAPAIPKAATLPDRSVLGLSLLVLLIAAVLQTRD